MSSLYRRPTPFGAALLRITEGSARAAFHDHPDWGIKATDRAARSVAKRVAGTVAADWPRLSAIAAKAGMVAKLDASFSSASSGACGQPDDAQAGGGGQLATSTTRAGMVSQERPGPLARARLHGLQTAHKAVAAMIGETKRAETAGAISTEDAAARKATLIDALRIIKRVIEGEGKPVFVRGLPTRPSKD